MFALLSLLACGQSITVDVQTDGCENFDFDNPQDSSIQQSWEGGGNANVWRTAVVLEGSNLAFDPKIEASGASIKVTELFTGEPDGTSFCYQPTVLIGGITSNVEVQWFTEDDAAVPFATVKVEAE